MEKIRELVFDFDGVLVDTTIACGEEIQIVGKKLTGKRFDLETIFSCWGVIFEDYLRLLYPEVTLAMYLEARRELGFDKKIPPRVIGVRRTIDFLAKIFPLSIVTNREKNSLKEIMQGAEIDESKFRFIQSCSDTPFHKPDPRVFQRYWEMVDRENLSPGQVLYVGDHLVDYQAASLAGFSFVGVLSGRIVTRQDFLACGVRAEAILDSVCELPKYLGLVGDETGCSQK